MIIVYWACMIGLTVAAALVIVRLVRGPTTADRVVAVDTILLISVAALGVRVAQTGETRYIVLLIAFSMLAFVATTAAARYLERRAIAEPVPDLEEPGE